MPVTLVEPPGSDRGNCTLTSHLHVSLTYDVKMQYIANNHLKTVH